MHRSLHLATCKCILPCPRVHASNPVSRRPKGVHSAFTQTTRRSELASGFLSGSNCVYLSTVEGGTRLPEGVVSPRELTVGRPPGVWSTASRGRFEGSPAPVLPFMLKLLKGYA